MAQLRTYEAFREALARLDIPTTGAVLLGGPGVAGLAQGAEVALTDARPDLVVIGGPAPDVLTEEAVPAATGLPDASFDAVLFLAAWRDPAELEAVTREVVRLVRPGGVLGLGDLDADGLTDSTPAAYRAAMLYEAYPEVAAAVRERHSHVALLGIEAVRAGIRPVMSDVVDLPLAVLDTAEDYLAGVRAGMWAGVDLLDEEQLAKLLEEVRVSLRWERFPLVERQPWVLIRGTKPG